MLVYCDLLASYFTSDSFQLLAALINGLSFFSDSPKYLYHTQFHTVIPSDSFLQSFLHQ